MFVKVWPVAVSVALFSASVALAQGPSDIGGPRELPPAGYTQQQYVDSRGCVFLRAGYGGKTVWVPRVGGDRKVLCGYPPTFGKQVQQAVAALDSAPAQDPVQTAPKAPVTMSPEPVRVAETPIVRAPKPAPSAKIPESAYVPAPVANLPAVTAQKRPDAPIIIDTRATAPVVVAQSVGSGSTGRRIACTTAAPVAERVALTNGGSVVVCTRGDGTLNGWRSPIYPDGAPIGAALSDGPATAERGPALVPLGQPEAMARVATAETRVKRDIAVPKGYTLVWKDDRLNPLRGIGTAEGQAAQDQIWNRKIPAQLVDPSDAPVASVSSKSRVTVSTKSAPVDPVGVAPVASGPAYIQVGAFGVAANAQGAVARLQAAGLPVAVSRSGKGLQVVLAGPFGSAGQAQRALSAARGAGFGDAFIR